MKRYQLLIPLSLFLIALFVSPSHLFAQYPKVAPGDSITLGEFIYDDNYVATTTPCTITIINPSGVVVVSDAVTSAEVTGWHSYTYTVPSSGPTGSWPAVLTCGSQLGGDLIRGDKTFLVDGVYLASSSTIATSVWSSIVRRLTDETLTSGGSLAKLSDIQSASSSLSNQITTENNAVIASVSSASSSLSGQIATTNANVLSASSTLGSAIASISSLISALNNLSASDVWSYGSRSLSTFGSLATDVWTSTTRTLTSAGLTTGSLATLSDVNSASSSLSGQVLANTALINSVNANVSSASSSLSGQIATTNANVLSASTTLGGILATVSGLITSLNNISVSDIWNSPTRTLTSFGTLASDIQTNINTNTDARIGQATSSITTTISSASSSLSGQIQTISSPTGTWSVTLSNTASITTGKTYRAKLYTSRAGSPNNTFATPRVTLYDSSRNIVASSIPMTNLGTGIYEYTYSVPANAAQGAWETVIDTETENGLYVQNNDFWQVAGSPAQVIINSIPGLTTPNISANVTITNEGLSGYEYQYEWCVVSDNNNACGNGDDTYHATAAKFINPGEDFNTTLTATVPNAGNYYFKMVVYFGTEKSGSSRSFTATAPVVNNGGGGGGGSSTYLPTPITTGTSSLPTISSVCNGADINNDKKVNMTDFSIMMAFWKTKAPFKNTCVDINKDTKVDSRDFSLLLAQWGTRGTPYIKK